MAQWRDFLGRFRPAGAPGAAVPRGVPTDRKAAAAAELEQLLDLVDEIDDEADRIRRAACEQAEQVRARGRADAEEALRDARAAADTVAADEAARVRAAAVHTEDDLVAAHAAAVAAMRARIATHLTDYLDTVVAHAKTILTAGPGR